MAKAKHLYSISAPPSPPCWSERDVAEYLGTAPATVRFWRYAGTGPRYYRVGRSIRYSKADVDAYLKAAPSGK